MTASDTPNSATEQKRAERLDVARTAYHALAVQDANRVITLCDIRGRLIARHDLRGEQGALFRTQAAFSSAGSGSSASAFELLTLRHWPALQTKQDEPSMEI
jgi:hypothetical protein